MESYSFTALGTRWRLGLRGESATEAFAALEAMAHAFDITYSRFIPDSLVSQLAKTPGRHTVPRDLVAMLRLYEELYHATGGAVNPAIGFALEDTGYDSAYTLEAKTAVRSVPPLPSVLTIHGDTDIELHEPVLLDLGALGKGYLVDVLFREAKSLGFADVLIDGSGDIRYDASEPIVCGLEDPREAGKVIGTLSLQSGALCASATNRRRWEGYSHYLDPHTKTSPTYVVATWVVAETAALADGLSTALFFVPPEDLAQFSFAYCIMNHEGRIKKSTDFAADFFTR